MECDIDDDAREEINKLIFDLAELKKKLNQDEDKEWDLLPRNLKIELTRQGKGNIKGYFNKDKIYYQLYLEESVKVYRQILRSLSRLTKRLDYYKAEIIEA
jgi:hypothetical protein